MPINYNLLNAIQPPKQIATIAPSGGGGEDDIFGGISSLLGAIGGLGGKISGPTQGATSAPTSYTNTNTYGSNGMSGQFGTSQFQSNPQYNYTPASQSGQIVNQTLDKVQQGPTSIGGNAFTPIDNRLGYKSQDLQGLYQRPAFQTALEAQNKALQTGLTKSPVMTVVDYSIPSNQPRMWVVDTKQNKVLMNTYVAQGSTPGFSNNPGSHQSSLGTYITDQIYNGKHGTSMRVRGLEKGVNDNAFARSIVVHGGSYVGPDKQGTSWGCFTVPNDVAPKLIGLTKGGSIIHAYAPGQKAVQNFSNNLTPEGSKVLQNNLMTNQVQLKPTIPNSAMTQNKPNQYIDTAVQTARSTYPDNDVMAGVMAAQAILESRLNSKPSGLAAQHNNYFGIKGAGSAGSANMPTTEYVHGKAIRVNAPFAAFNSPEESFARHKDLMENGTKDNPARYQPVLKARSVEEAAQALVKGGYATDPNYARLIVDTYNKYVKPYMKTSMNNPNTPITQEPRQPTPQEHKDYEDIIRQIDQGRDSYASLGRVTPQANPEAGTWDLPYSNIPYATPNQSGYDNARDTMPNAYGQPLQDPNQPRLAQGIDWNLLNALYQKGIA